MTGILLGFVCLLLVTGLFVAALDVSKMSAEAIDRLRARRASRRGWDWAAFEREFADYTGRGRHGRATPRRH